MRVSPLHVLAGLGAAAAAVGTLLAALTIKIALEEAAAAREAVARRLRDGTPIPPRDSGEDPFWRQFDDPQTLVAPQGAKVADPRGSRAAEVDLSAMIEQIGAEPRGPLPSPFLDSLIERDGGES